LATNPRERLAEIARVLQDKGFRVEVKGESVYVVAGSSDAVLADLPREFVEEVLRAGFGELVLVAGKNYYYFRGRDLEKVLSLKK